MFYFVNISLAVVYGLVTLILFIIYLKGGRKYKFLLAEAILAVGGLIVIGFAMTTHFFDLSLQLRVLSNKFVVISMPLILIGYILLWFKIRAHDKRLYRSRDARP
jgi:hypothetical protein